jgi:hypothetical protein
MDVPSGGDVTAKQAETKNAKVVRRSGGDKGSEIR